MQVKFHKMSISLEEIEEKEEQAKEELEMEKKRQSRLEQKKRDGKIGPQFSIYDQIDIAIREEYKSSYISDNQIDSVINQNINENPENFIKEIPKDSVFAGFYQGTPNNFSNQAFGQQNNTPNPMNMYTNDQNINLLSFNKSDNKAFVITNQVPNNTQTPIRVRKANSLNAGNSPARDMDQEDQIFHSDTQL